MRMGNLHTVQGRIKKIHGTKRCGHNLRKPKYRIVYPTAAPMTTAMYPIWYSITRVMIAQATAPKTPAIKDLEIPEDKFCSNFNCFNISSSKIFYKASCQSKSSLSAVLSGTDSFRWKFEQMGSKSAFIPVHLYSKPCCPSIWRFKHFLQSFNCSSRVILLSS